MTFLVATARKLTVDERGATAIEYALIASLLGLALIPVLSNTKSGMAGLFYKVNDYFDVINK